MTQRLQNRSTAIIITLCVIVFSVLLGASLSLNRLRGEAEDVFNYGPEGSWHGINSDLYSIAADSSNLVTVASRYMNENDKRIDAVRRCVDNLYMAGTPGENYDAAGELRVAYTELDAHLETLELLETDVYYREKLAANMESYYRTIERSSYNDTAAAFNNELKRFPTNILSDITGVKPLELYE